MSRIFFLAFVPVAALAILYQAKFANQFAKLGVTSKRVSTIEHGTSKCRAIPELVACEDQFIHRQSGTSYLPCSSLEGRSLWSPAMSILKLNKTTEATVPSDTIQLFNLNTNAVQEVKIVNRPAHLAKLHLHALEGYTDNDIDMTFFINNHGVPASEDASLVGADSTIEVFTGKIGSTEWKWQRSIRHELIRTPNNIVAISKDKFYVSNDHPDKVGFRRKLTIYEIPGGRSGIIFCDISSGSPLCKQVADGFYHPNGLTKGPGNTIYFASTFMSTITHFEIQADYSLSLLEELPINFKDYGILDNIAVDESGSIICPIIVSGVAFEARAKNAGKTKAPVQVWRIYNNTQTDERFYGQKYEKNLLLSDTKGKKISGATNAQLYKKKLYITGFLSDSLLVCDR